MCSIDPGTVGAFVLAVLVQVGLISAAVARLAPQIAQNKKDVQAAWDRLHVHDEKLNGGPQEPVAGSSA